MFKLFVPACRIKRAIPHSFAVRAFTVSYKRPLTMDADYAFSKGGIKTKYPAPPNVRGIRTMAIG